MGDPTRGLYQKFTVRRTDGSSQPGGKHDGCEYFVLDLTHDPHAGPALRAYAENCRADYPLLSADLDRRAGDAGVAPQDESRATLIAQRDHWKAAYEHLVRAGDAEAAPPPPKAPAMTDAYFIEVEKNGCEKCSHGKLWAVVGPDGVAQSTMFEDPEDAQNLADALNEAFAQGAGATQPSPPLTMC